MKAGFIQFAPKLGDSSANIERLEQLLPLAASADLVVLPELCHCGYNFESRQQAWNLSEPVKGGEFVAYLESVCRERGFHIVAGLNERDGDRLYNSAVLVGPEGVVGVYRKLHLFLNEKDIFTPGDLGLPVFDIGPAKVGILICFDWIFPETWRVLALRGADIICHPSNLIIPGLAQRAVPIQALMNRVYIITANRCGSEGDLHFTGLSLIADPRGNIPVRAFASGDEVRIIDMDVGLARDKKVTERNDVLADRRPEYYDLLTER